jgi:RHS repeat-associated protein
MLPISAGQVYAQTEAPPSIQSPQDSLNNAIIVPGPETGSALAARNETQSSPLAAGNVTQNSPLAAANETEDEELKLPLSSDNETQVLPIASDPKKVIVSVSPDKETEINSLSGKVKLKIPKGAVSELANIAMEELGMRGSTGMKILNLIDLNANLKASGKKLNKFNKGLEITIKHTNHDLAGINVDSLRLFYLDEKSRQWISVETSRFDKKTMVLTATIDHFSEYGEQADPLISGPGRVMASEVNLHSGAATYSYPFELPPGPGGFQPKLTLNYNSGSVDEMKNKRSTASWVGMGWSLDLGKISYDSAKEIYYLDLNGASYQLATSDNVNYRTNPDQYFKITRNGNTWVVLDKDGYYYRFGGTTNSQQYVPDTQDPPVAQCYRWDLSLMKDTNGNQATVTYIQDNRGTTPYNWIRSAYPSSISYGNITVEFTSNYDQNDPIDGYLRNDNPKTYDSGSGPPYTNPAPAIMENRRLTSIQVKRSSTLIRKYSFSYQTTAASYSTDYQGIYYSGTMILQSVTQKGADGTSALPSLTFSYSNLSTYRHATTGDYVGNPGNPASFNWPHLTGIDSGYGGIVSYTYDEIPDNTEDDIWTREVIISKTISSGIGSSQVTTYTYPDNPDYLGVGWEQKYRGFPEVMETDAAGNYIEHWYFTTGEIDGKDAERLTGREYKTQWYSSENFLLDEKLYDWNWIETSNDYDVRFSWGGTENDTSTQSFWGPKISNDGNIYTTEIFSNKRVKKFSEYRDFILEWGSYGLTGAFSNPSGVAIDSAGNVYITDTSTNRVLKFDSSGNSVMSLGVSSSGGGNYEFISPYSVAIDSQGYIYVADTNHHRIQKFDSDGNFVLKLGTYGSGNGQFSSPYGVAVDSNGHVYVADTGSNRVQKFDSDGNFLLKWGTSGSGDGQFSSPRGIIIDNNGDVYVGDTNNSRIQKFDSNGGFLLKWGSGGSGDGQFNQPWGVAVDGNGNIYVADVNNNRIQKFDSNGGFLLKWGLQGTGDGQFKKPNGVCVSSGGSVYVADTDNKRVQKFNSSGSYQTKWDSYTAADGEFYDPRGIGFDSQGNVYILDSAGLFSGNNRVQKFDSNGEFILKWGLQGTGDGQFWLAQGLVVDNQDNIYVTDAFNYRVQKFDSSGNFILKWGSSGTGNGQFDYLQGICIDAQGYVYVVDGNMTGGGNNRIQKFDSNGNFILSWGTYGTGDGQLNHPHDVAVDSEGYIYVADSGNHRIQKFTSSGSYVRKWDNCYANSLDVSNHSLYMADYVCNDIVEIAKNWAIQLLQVDETVGDKTSRVRYVYDNGTGNVITEYHDGDTSTNADDATVHRLFYPNTTDNILSKVARERVYATIVANDNGGANLKKESLYYYDGNNNSLSTPPTKGNLTRVQQTKDSQLNTVSSYYTYDAYGNKLTSVDPNNNTTTMTYDATYHTYPATKTLPLASPTLSESYTYDPGTSNMLSKVDVNGQTTSYVYDTFKRLTKVVKPGDSTQSPSIEYQYNSWGALDDQHIKTITKVDANHSLWKSDFFDGLGRIIQTQSSGTTGRTIISGTTTYNALGLVDKSYVSQDLASGGVSGYEVPDAGWKYSTYTYDGLGRAITLTSSDGTVISHDYSTSWKDVVTNELGKKKNYYYDAFQRLVEVEELDNSFNVYATTLYTYDTLGNLTQVEDNDSNVTSMTYDWLSRKIGMTDPDMGAWSYVYDSAGNLTSQTDAKNQTITMTYDALNRLTLKDYPQGSGTTDVTYTYDSTSGGNYGKGQRTGMTDALGTTSYKYDTRGRQIEEKRTVDAVDYTTGFTYDGADRVATVTYPTGEVVTNGYDERGLPYSLSGSVAGTLVTDSYYNQIGGITQINLGNGLKNVFGYWGVGGQYDTAGGYYGRLWRTATATILAPDTTTPAAVTNLATDIPTLNSIHLTWTAPGDDGGTGTAASYDIRYSTSAITSGNWVSATPTTGEPTPQAAGNSEGFTVTSLSPGITYYFAVKTTDDAGNLSTISNCPSNMTLASDTAPPAVVANLAAGNPGTNSITLTWTAPGDDGSTGTAASYDVRYSTSAITAGNWASATPATGEPTPQAAGNSESFTVEGLNSNTTYYFAIKTSDEVPNVSAISNCPSGTAATAATSEILRPNATGSESYLGGGWSVVDEVTPDEYSTFVYTENPYGARDLYNLPSHTGSGIINSVSIYARCSCDSSVYAGNAMVSLKSGSSTQNGSVNQLSQSWVNISGYWNIDPNTGAAWTWAAIDNLQIGVSLSAGCETFYQEEWNEGCWCYVQVPYYLYYPTYCTQVYVVVNFTPDITPPAAVTNLTAGSPTDDSLSLSWTSPGDDGSTGTATSYDMRYSTSPITINNWASATQATGEPAPQAAGTSQSMTVTGLNANTTYYFTIRSSDEGPNVSAISNCANGTTKAPGQTEILTPNAAGDETGISSQYPTSGSHFEKVDDTPGSPDDNSTYVKSTNSSYQRDFYNLTNHTGSGIINYIEIKYRFASSSGSYTAYLKPTIKTGGMVYEGTEVTRQSTSYIDGSYRWTVNPNTGSAWTWAELDSLQAGISLHKGTSGEARCTQVYIKVNYSPDSTPPAAITNLATGNPTSNSIQLTWTAPGDDGSTGTATSYDVRYATSTINADNWASATQVTGEPAPQAAGSNQNFTVNGLSQGVTYYFAMKTSDEVTNISNISNCPSGIPSSPDNTAPAAISNLATGNPTSNSIHLTWTAPGDDGSTGTATSYDVRYATSTINADNWASATQATGEPAPQAAGSNESFVVTGLSLNTTYYFAVKTADEASNISAISNCGSATTCQGGVFFDTRYTWDAGGNLTQRQDFLASQTESFTYDFLDRLTGVSGPYTQSFAYNQIGNITTMNGTAYTYSAKPHAVTAVGATNYVYDANGNMTTRGGQTVTWDYENRPVTVSGGASFVYDGDGNRVKKTEGGQIVLYVNKYYEKNLTTGEVTTYYYLGGQQIAMRKGATLTYTHQDHLSGTSMTSNASGASTGTIKYFAFGECRNSTDTSGTDKLFTGQRLDTTGLYYYNARYYDPTIGRFISADTAVHSIANPQSLNRYSYVINNPLKYSDPNGLDYVIMGGTGSTEAEAYAWECFLTSSGMRSLGEPIYFLPDIDPYNWDINPRVIQLQTFVNDNQNNLTNIKFIGHSEGAAALGQYWANHFAGISYIPESVVNQTKGVFLLDCPTGLSDSRVRYDSSYLNGVGDKLANMPIPIKSADIYNSLSVVHNGGLSGWEEVDVATTSDKIGYKISLCLFPQLAIINAWQTTVYYHEKIKKDAMTVIKSILTN